MHISGPLDLVLIILLGVIMVVVVVARTTNMYAAAAVTAVLVIGSGLAVDLVGASLLIATMLLLAVLASRCATLLVRTAFGDRVSTQAWASFLDALITSRDRSQRDGEDRRGLPPDGEPGESVTRRPERDDDR